MKVKSKDLLQFLLKTIKKFNFEILGYYNKLKDKK